RRRRDRPAPRTARAMLRAERAVAILRASDRARVSREIIPLPRRSALNRPRAIALAGLVATLLVCGGADPARAAAERHKCTLVLTASPSQILGGDFNDQIDFFNRTMLVPRGLESLDEISYGWLFDAELRYFIRPNFAISGGAGQIRSQTRREYSFSPVDNITVEAEVLSVPIHLGGTFYFAPYNQGDFQARAYLGGGILSLTGTHGTITSVVTFPSSPTIPSGTFENRLAGDAPGWYAELGAHMFFAVRYSVMIGAIYRSAVVGTTAAYVNERLAVENINQSVDVGGLGARLSLAIGF